MGLINNLAVNIENKLRNILKNSLQSFSMQLDESYNAKNKAIFMAYVRHLNKNNTLYEEMLHTLNLILDERRLSIITTDKSCFAKTYTI
jgi:hypothetical protein